VLALDRFRLRDEVEARINQYRDAERRAAFQQWLLPGSPLVVSDASVFDFKKTFYAPSWSYEGTFQFKRHYFGAKPGELSEFSASGNVLEEFRCAQFIDDLAGIRFWVRNLARKAGSFRLQTSTDWFYPDFVCQLVDGRFLVVEYKGAHLYADSEEKRLVGAVWASRSGGRCLFAMPTDLDFSSIAAAVAQ